MKHLVIGGPAVGGFTSKQELLDVVARAFAEERRAYETDALAADVDPDRLDELLAIAEREHAAALVEIEQKLLRILAGPSCDAEE